MGIVVGFGTTATLGGVCAVSASWGANPNTQRLFCLDGTFVPKFEIKKPTQTANMSVYSPGPTVDITASEGCDAYGGDIDVTITPSSCGGGTVPGLTGSFYVNSYSYSREDTTMPGQESWSLIKYIGTNPPTFIIRGISEGQWTDGSGVEGTVMDTATAGNVSAGGIGRADTLNIGIVTSVGGGDSTGDNTGQASVSVQLTPLWI